MVRFILAATHGPSYGNYGPVFELCENMPIAPGREECLDPEKCELRTWDLDNPLTVPAHIFVIRRKVRTEHDFGHYL